MHNITYLLFADLKYALVTILQNPWHKITVSKKSIKFHK